MQLRQTYIHTIMHARRVTHTYVHSESHIHTHACTQAYMHEYTYIPYISVLKPGSSTCRGSNICRVVQQNERNKCLGPFKCQVPKLLNLINLKMVPNIKENYIPLKPYFKDIYSVIYLISGRYWVITTC